LDHVNIRFGGGFGSVGQVTVASSGLALTNSTISNSANDGVRIVGSNPTLTNNTYSNNASAAISMDLASNPAISGVTVTNNGINGLQLDAGTLTGNGFWNDPDIVYWLDGDTTVPNGSTLTVGAGQVVKFSFFGADLFVDGRMLADGTVAAPIVFTEARDDAAGGDTNNDMVATSPARGNWGRIELRDPSTASVLDHVNIRFGGGFGSVGQVTVTSSELTLTNSTISNSGSVGLLAGNSATVTATNSLIVGNSDTGIRAESSATVTATNNTLDGNFLGAAATGVGTLLTLTNNLITFNSRSGVLAFGGAIIRANFNDVYNPTATSGNYEGLPSLTGTNRNVSADPLYVNRIVSDYHLKAGSPAIDAGTSNGAPADDLDFNWRIDDLATGNTGAGTFPFYDLGALEFGGRTRAVAHRPSGDVADVVRDVIFEFRDRMDVTSFSVGADVLQFTGPGGPINVTDFRWLNPYQLEVNFGAQAVTGDYTLALGPNILNTTGGTLDVDGDGTRGEAIDDRYAATWTIVPPRIVSHSPDDFVGGPIDRVLFAFDREMNTQSFSVAADVVSFTGPNGPLQATGFDWTDAKTLAVMFAPQTALGFYEMVLGPDILDTSGDPLDQDGNRTPGESPSDRYTATFTLANVVRISGDITQDTTLGGLVIVEDSVTVRSPATLTFSPAAIVKVFDLKGITVMAGATLNAIGTSAQPIRITSIHDDTIGGDTDRNGDRFTPQPGAWTTIFVDGGTARLESGHVRYGGGSPTGVWNLTAMLRTSGTATLDISKSILSDVFFDGVLTQGGTTTITSTVVSGADRGVVSWLADANVQIMNSTFDDNRIGLLGHGGVLNVVNSIVSNSHSVGIDNDIDPDPTVRYTDLFSPSGLNFRGFTNPVGSNGNVSVDPKIKDPARGDYRLDFLSPVIDAADGPAASATDLVGSPRYDDPRTPNTGVARADITFADMGAFEFVEGAPSDIDLIVTAVAGPATAVAGTTITVTSMVRNVGIGVAPGSWHDGVFLSRDNVWSLDDVLVGESLHTGDIGPNQSYQTSAEVTLPIVVPGDYYLLVRANSDFALFEGANASNNTKASAAKTTVDLLIAELTLGTPFPDQFTPNVLSHYYRLTPPAGQTLEIILDSTATSGSNEMFLRRGAIPTPTEFDGKHQSFAEPDQRLVLPTTQPGTYYLLVRSEFGATRTSDYTLLARAGTFGLTKVSPSSGANAGAVTIEISGNALSADTTVELVANDGATIMAHESFLRDASSMFATFDLNEPPTGVYGVRLTKRGTVVTAPEAFTLRSGEAGHVNVRVIQPSNVRPSRDSQITVQYSNDGDTDAIAPFISVSSSEALLRFPGEPFFLGSAVQFLGINQSGPARILPPHTTHSVTIDFRPNTAGTAIQFIANVIPRSDDPSNLNTYKDSLRPPGVDDEGWDAVWANFVASVGTTVRSFQNVLVENAEYLSKLGEYTFDISRLLRFEIQQAANSVPFDSLTGAIDVFHAAPGLPLKFNRGFNHPLTNRYALGPFGRSWTHGWNISAVEGANGDVAIQGGGVFRQFRKMPNGTYQAGPGDSATLKKTAGKFTLQEPDGTVFSFRFDGLPDFTADVNGNRITAIYTGGRLTQLTHSNGDAIQIAYNAAGRITTIIDGPKTIAFSYDASNEHLMRVTSPDGTTDYSYDTGSNTSRRHALLSVQSSDGTQLQFEYDDRGRVTGIATNGGQAPVTFAYGTAGNISVTDASGVSVSVDFNDSRKVAHTRDHLGLDTHYRYDASGNLTSQVGPNGLTASNEYDSQGNLTKQVDSAGNGTELIFDPASQQPVGRIDVLGNRTSYGYDPTGNLATVTGPDGTVRSLTYDTSGYPTVLRNGRNEEMRYMYDAQGRIVQKTYPDGSQSSFTYSVRGNLTSYADSHGTTTMTYDAADRLTRVDYPGERFLNYQYDTAGRRSQIVDQEGFTTNYSYDAQGRLTILTDALGANIVSYEYDSAGRLEREVKGNGTTTTYEYNAFGQIIRMRNLDPAAQLLSKFEYTFDQFGRRSSVTTLDGETQYEYNDAGRLVAANLPGGRRREYVYNSTGSLAAIVDQGQTTNYLYNDFGRITTVGAAAYTFDVDGNLVGRSENDQQRSYTYDAENRLLRATGPEGTTDYSYDALGHLVARTVNGVRTELVPDLVRPKVPVAEYPAGGSSVHYTQGHGLVSRTASPPEYYEFDPEGNTVSVTNSSGQRVNSYSYLPDGTPDQETETVPNSFQYGGRYGTTQRENSPPSADVLSAQMSYYSASFDANFAHANEGNRPRSNGGIASFEDALSFLFVPQFLNTAGSLITSGFLGTFEHPGQLFRVGIVDRLAQGSVGNVLNLPFQALLAYIKFKNPDMGAQGRSFIDLVGSTASLGAYLRGAAGSLFGTSVSNPLNVLKTPLGTFGTTFIGETASRFGIVGNVLRRAPVVGGLIQAGTFGWSLGRFIDESIQSTEEGRIFMEDFFDGVCETLSFICPSVSVSTGVVRSFDPNEVIGPAGFGDQRWIPPEDVLPYTILFENKATASAPALDVFVTNSLDPDLDWSTVELVSAGFGSVSIPIPAGRQSYTTNVTTLNPDSTPLRVVFSADLNRETGIFSWAFRSIDPATGLEPEDPFAGFLPPNDSAPRGEGFVSYRVRPRAGLATGTKIENGASIVFDTNEPIVTNTFLNTIDRGAPTSTVAALPVKLPAQFDVRWSGSDDADGSGVAFFDVFVSDNGGPFQLWLNQATVTSDKFVGQDKHTYRFYSVATDNVGHVEQKMPVAEAETTVQAGPQWHNSVRAEDVDADGEVAPVDVLQIINELNQPAIALAGGLLPVSGVKAPPPFLDVDGDGFVSPIDALIVINFLNNRVTQGEGGTGSPTNPLVGSSPWLNSPSSNSWPLRSLASPRLASQSATAPPAVRIERRPMSLEPAATRSQRTLDNRLAARRDAEWERLLHALATDVLESRADTASLLL
jgi:YD repeat-containing protein